MLRGLKQRFPAGASEGVHHGGDRLPRAAQQRSPIRETLERLRDAGMDSLPGGGAEIFSERVRRIICDHKIDGSEWLETARTAHQLGLHSNCTMLYGHIENEEDRVDHLVRLRDLAGRDQRLRRPSSRWRSIPTTRRLQHIPKTTGFRRYQEHRGCRA